MDVQNRKALTFEQAEGAAPLPRQLSKEEISPELRSAMKAIIHIWIGEGEKDRGGPSGELDDRWHSFFLRNHIHRRFETIRNFSKSIAYHQAYVDRELSQDYLAFYGFIQFLLRDPDTPKDLVSAIEQTLVLKMAGYRVFDNDTLVPVASEEEVMAIQKSLADVSQFGSQSTRRHLKAAGEQLSGGNWADSVRESIHTVEACARTIEPKASTLSDALKTLERSLELHPALKSGFISIYGYISDEAGVRHALTKADVANVDETDAVFMFGACASFCSYLPGKKQKVSDTESE